MTHYQPGLFALGTRFHYHLELDVRAGVAEAAVVAALDRLREPAVTAGGTNIVVGFGPDLWRRLAPTEAPPDLVALEPMSGPGGSVPAIGHDVWVWVHGAGPDVVLDVSRAAAAALAPALTLGHHQPSWVHHDNRDMTGFIDGTANPPIDEAPYTVLVPDGEPGAGGTVALVQRWVHDLEAFHKLPEDEQERVFGRTRDRSIELSDDVKPRNAHVARVSIVDDAGEELEILRRSTPYGTVVEQGLFFVALSRDRARLARMLRAMLGLEDGIHDRLLDFSRPVTGSLYFVPSLDAMRSLPGASTGG